MYIYTKFQIDISKHVEEKSGKRGQTDRRTEGHCHGIIRPFFKWAFKNDNKNIANMTKLRHILCHDGTNYIRYIKSKQKVS